MDKILLTLFVIAAVDCGDKPTQIVRFHTSIAAEGAAPQRSLLVGLADPQSKLQFDQMAVAGNFLYFNIPWYGVYRMPKYGGDVHPIEEATGVENFQGVAANGTDVYWARESNFGSAGPDFPHTRLRGQALGGGPIRTVAEGDIGIDDEWGTTPSVFFAHRDAVYGSVSYPHKDIDDLTRFPLDGNPSAVLRRVELHPPSPWINLVTDEDFAYLTSCDSNGKAGCVLTNLDLQTSSSDTLATFVEDERVVAVDATDLYLVTAHYQLVRLAKQGAGAPAVVATFGEHDGLSAQALVDEQDVYLIAKGALVSVPKEGGTPRVLAAGFEYFNGFVQDERNVFVMYHLDAIDVVPKNSSPPSP